jgi:hypothetical protein
MAYALPRAPQRTPRRRERPPKPDQRRRALELLAGCGPDGCNEAVLLANGIDVDTMVQIILEGLAPRRRSVRALARGARGCGAANYGSGAEGVGRG